MDSTRGRKLLNLLRNFDAAMMNAFGKYLHSPFFHPPPVAVKLFENICDLHPSWAGDLSHSEKLFAALYPGKAFSPNRLGRAFHELFAAAKSFLAHYELASDGLLSERLFMRRATWMHDRSFFEKSQQTLLTALNAPDKEGQKLSGHALRLKNGIRKDDLHKPYALRFEILSENYLNPNLDKLQPSIRMLPEVSAALDLHFVLWRLFLSCELSSRRKFLNEDLHLPFQAEVEAQAEKLAPVYPEVKAYLQLLSLIRGAPDRVLFRQLEEGLPSLSPDVAKAILMFLINCAIKLSNDQGKVYYGHLVNLYLYGIKSGLLLEKGKLPTSTFINASNAFAMAGMSGGGHSFINQQQGLLIDSQRRDTVSLCRAYLLFHEGEHTKALQQTELVCLSRLSLRHSLIARPLLIRCLFEAWAVRRSARSDYLMANIDSFRKYIVRNKILSPRERQRYARFCAILNSIVKHASQRKQVSQRVRNTLGKKINSEPRPFAFEWLEQKSRQLLWPGK